MRKTPLHAPKRLTREGRLLRRVINATGVLLHTNLGRARMDQASARRAAEAAAQCYDLEFDIDTGRRGDRFRAVTRRLRRLLGVEGALVVNNNAAAVFLAVHVLAAGGGVIVARSELVEIGGSFRIPGIIESAGAKMFLVGSANRVCIEDYQAAVELPGAALILKIHQSNFRMTGEVESVSTRRLAGLARTSGLPFVEDLGSGNLVNLEEYGLPFNEPRVSDVLGDGADLVTFSGDKLLGGPQCGIIAGSVALTDRIRACDLLRVVRVGKVIDSLLCECLDRYIEGGHDRIPFFRMLSVDLETLEERAVRIVTELASTNLRLSIVESRAQLGAGACPEKSFPSRAVLVELEGLSPGRIRRRLLAADPPVVCRIADNTCMLDLGSLLPEDIPFVINALKFLAG